MEENSQKLDWGSGKPSELRNIWLGSALALLVSVPTCLFIHQNHLEIEELKKNREFAAQEAARLQPTNFECQPNINPVPL